MKTPLEKLEAKVEKTDSCWLWRGTIRSTGYGSFYDGKPRLAHRVAYELLVGPIPEGLVVDHLCFVRHCVNPSHLEAVTQAENQRRLVAARTHCKRGHEFSPENTGRHPNGGRYCRACQNTYTYRIRRNIP